MPDTYVTRIRQVARLVGYGELQVLEVFKNTVPNRLYWVLFPIDNPREAVETAKRFLTKEKIDRQIIWQSSTPFVNLNDKKGKKAVSFNARDVLERNNKNMEKMTVLMDKMYIKLDEKDVSYKSQIYQKRGRGQNRQNFRQNNNNWRNRSFRRERNYNSNRGYGWGRGYFRRGGFWGRKSGNFRGNNSRDRNREDRRPWRQSRSRERGIRTRSKSSSRSRSNSRVSTNRDRVRCFKCREYDHFANECPNLVLEDSDRENDSARQGSLQILADSDTGSEVEQYLNIWKVRMVPPHFCL